MLYLLLHHHMTTIDDLDTTNDLQQLIREISLSDPAKKLIDIHQAVLLNASLRQLLSIMLSKNQSLRSAAQDILRLKIAHWLPEKQEQFIQFCMKKLQEGCANDRVLALEMLDLMKEKVPVETFLPFL